VKLKPDGVHADGGAYPERSRIQLAVNNGWRPVRAKLRAYAQSKWSEAQHPDHYFLFFA